MGLRESLLGTAVSAMLSEPGLAARRAWYRRSRAAERIKIELFFDASDPYGLLLVQAVHPLLSAPGVELSMTLVPPPSRDADPEPGLRRAYALRDARELCRHHEVAFPAEAALPSRPFVELANAILAEARPIEEQLALARAVGDALFRGEGLGELARRAGRTSVERAARVLADGAERRRALGHYVGGTLYCEGEWYWGVDRLPLLEERLRGEGVDVALSCVRQPRLPVPRDEARSDTVEVFFSFRSPYSYIALVRIAELARRHQKELVLRPVVPLVVRGARIPLAKKIYIVADAAREARRHGVPFGKIADPIGIGIERAMALFAWAKRERAEVPLTLSLMRGIWSEARSVADERELRVMVERAGLSWHRAEAHLSGEGWRSSAEANRAALYDLGLWGVPSFATGGFSTWGQDRLDYVAERLARDGRG